MSGKTIPLPPDALSWLLRTSMLGALVFRWRLPASAGAASTATFHGPSRDYAALEALLPETLAARIPAEQMAWIHAPTGDGSLS